MAVVEIYKDSINISGDFTIKHNKDGLSLSDEANLRIIFKDTFSIDLVTDTPLRVAAETKDVRNQEGAKNWPPYLKAQPGDKTLSDYVEDVMRETKRPMNTEELAERVIKNGYKTDSKHPNRSVYAMLRKNAAGERGVIKFKRYSPKLWGLIELEDTYNEDGSLTRLND